MTSQLATALEALHIGMSHHCLSLLKVMLVNHEKEPFRVKLINFVEAGEVSTVPQVSTIQPNSIVSGQGPEHVLVQQMNDYVWEGETASFIDVIVGVTICPCRPPEFMLGLLLTDAVDLWSLGFLACPVVLWHLFHLIISSLLYFRLLIT